MNNFYKYLTLYVGFVVLLIGIILGTGVLKEKNISFQKEMLIKQAKAHFEEQINMRRWNSEHGGIYVKTTSELENKSHLKDKFIETKDGSTLIRINPALMTKELSEGIDANKFRFKIVSLKPINEENKADKFEKKALDIIQKSNTKEYYEFDDNKNFRYLGAIVTTKSCLYCHLDANVGDVIGAISINIDTTEYEKSLDFINKNVTRLRVFIALLLFSIVILLRKQFKHTETLQDKIEKRTKEILTTKILLQEILDHDSSFLMLADARDIILANKTMLEFFGVKTLQEFKIKYKDISREFIDLDTEGMYWIDYLYDVQEKKSLERFMICMVKESKKRYFKPSIKKIFVQNKEFNIIIFDEVTQELENIKRLTDKADKDPLTNLFNRGKFDDVLDKEIELSKTTSSPLSVVFLDIDHFKKVNDTYGHKVGDYVLIEIANILRTIVRKGDFVARWGGEEFVVTLQTTDLREATKVAEHIREAVESFNFKEGGKQTVSLGVAQYIPPESANEFMKRADSALYEAKANGRNRVVAKK